MRRIFLTFIVAAVTCAPALAQEQVDIELMTYPEVATAMRNGKTTVLIYNGGTEQRGPHAVLGGHTLIARRASVEIARQLKNALVAPVLPFSIAGAHLNPKWPGSVNLPGPIFSAVNEAVVDSMVTNGFRNIVLMGDHGGGQRELEALAARLNQKYAPKGSHVYFCGDVYAKTQRDVAAWIKEHGLPPSTHGGIPDTSVLMFLGGDAYVRRDRLVAGDPVLEPGQRANSARSRVDNGVTGDPRRATPELGKLFFDMQVKNAVTQIRSITATAQPARGARVRIGVPERENIQYLTLWVALGAGYLQAEGLTVQFVVAPAPNQGAQLLLQNQADVALLPPPLYLGLIAQNRPIVLFANLLANDPINLIVRPDVAAARKLDPKAPLVNRLKALKGLRIGVANEPPRRLRVLFALAGMDADRDLQMTIVPAEGQIRAFTAGSVDALYTHTPYLEDALVSYGAVLMVNQSAGEVAPLNTGEVHSLAATREYANAHPDVLQAVTRAIARAEDLLHSDADASAKALLKAGIPAPSPAHLATIVGIYRAAVPATPRVSAAAVERDAKLYPARPAMPDFTRVHAADFVAPAFAGNAVDAPLAHRDR